MYIGISLTCCPVFAQNDNARNREAESIYTSFSIETIGARGAAQVSQLADQAQMKYSKIIIAQNEEIIALLKQLLLKPTGAPTPPNTNQSK